MPGPGQHESVHILMLVPAALQIVDGFPRSDASSHIEHVRRRRQRDTLGSGD